MTPAWKSMDWPEAAAAKMNKGSLAGGAAAGHPAVSKVAEGTDEDEEIEPGKEALFYTFSFVKK